MREFYKSMLLAILMAIMSSAGKSARILKTISSKLKIPIKKLSKGLLNKEKIVSRIFSASTTIFKVNPNKGKFIPDMRIFAG